MSIFQHRNGASIADEIERSARRLPAADETATIFLEERSSLRLRLDSRGERALTTTRSRGAAVGGPASWHLTDPASGQIEALAAGRRPKLGSTRMAGNTRTAHAGERSLPEATHLSAWLAGLEDRLTETLRRESSGITGAVWVAEVTASTQQIWVAARHGSVREDTRCTGRLELRAAYEGHPNSACVSDLVVGESGPVDLAGLLTHTLARAERRRGSLARPVLGPTSVILEAGLGGIVVHELVGHALEGDVRARGRTWIDGLERTSGPRLPTVVDDPVAGRAPWKIDDEGVVATRITLVEDGRPVDGLLDRRAALVLGRPSNGHGRRSSYLDPPLPRMGCTFIAAGGDDPDTIARETESALFIHRMTAGHTDPHLGRATFVVAEADLIRHGQCVAPLRPFVLEIDGAEAWRTLDRIGSDLVFDRCIGSCVREGQPLGVSVGAPTIRIGVVNVVA